MPVFVADTTKLSISTYIFKAWIDKINDTLEYIYKLRIKNYVRTA